MTTLKKIGLGIILVLLLAAAGGFGYVRHLATQGIPDYDGTAVLEGLTAAVTVYRDEHAVPHIYAQNEPDLYRAVGWCMAQDRLFQMDLIRRATTGRLSEIFGEQTVEVDHLMRALRIPEKSRLMIANTDPVILDLIDAFCDGVNQYVASHTKQLPVEFAVLGYAPEQWEVAHAFNMDFYLEKVNPDNPGQYEFNGQWRKMTVRRETIGVKGGEPVEKEIRFTHRGPIVSQFKNLSPAAISMRWTGNAYSNESRALYLLGRARNWSDFKHAIRTFNSVSQNVVYADVDGNIGLYCAAGVPIREKGAGTTVMPGWTDKYDWKGFVPFEALPHSYNPEQGSLCSANNKTVGDGYPYYISAWFVPDYRFRRIEEMLASKQKHSIDDFKRIQADWRSKLVADMLPDMVAVVSSAAELSKLERRAVALLATWDGVMTAESAAAALFETFYVQFMRNVFEDELGQELFDAFLTPGFVTSLAVARVWADRSSSWYDNVDSDGKKENFNDILRKSFKDAVAWLTAEAGSKPDKWQWGGIHTLTLAHPLGRVKLLNRVFNLNRGPFPVGGSSHTTSPYMYEYTEPFAVYHGASHRHIYSLADWNRSLSIIPTGTSGVPASPYYCDQTEDYLNNRYHADYVRRDLVEKSAKHVMKLSGK